jgi:uncharacterized protein YcfL
MKMIFLCLFALILTACSSGEKSYCDLVEEPVVIDESIEQMDFSDSADEGEDDSSESEEADTDI